MSIAKRNDWMKPEEVAEMLSVSVKTLAYWRCRRRHLPYTKVGNRIYYERSDVLGVLNKNRVEPDTAA